MFFYQVLHVSLKNAFFGYYTFFITLHHLMKPYQLYKRVVFVNKNILLVGI